MFQFFFFRQDSSPFSYFVDNAAVLLTKGMIVGVNSIIREMGWEHKLDHEAKLCLTVGFTDVHDYDA